MLKIAEVETAIIERLKDEINYLKTCESLGDFLLDEVEDITTRFPAIYVVYQGGDFENLTGGAQDREMTFRMVLMAKNLRGGKAPLHGEGADKGVYDMLEDVREALTGETCDLDISGLYPTSEEAIEGTKDVAIYGIDFRTRCEES